MRISPPVTIISLIACAFAAMAVLERAGSCVLNTETEQVSVVKLGRWLGDRFRHNGQDCDILSYEPAGGPTVSITVSQSSDAETPDVSPSTYALTLTRAGQFNAVKTWDSFERGGLESIVVRHSQSTFTRRASSEGQAAFAKVYALLAPLRFRALDESSPILRDMILDRGRAPFPPGYHRCRHPVSDHPGNGVTFQVAANSEPKWAVTGSCADQYTMAAERRINEATDIAFDAAGYHPRIVPIYYP